VEGIYTDDSFRGRISTVDKAGKRNWIYALKPAGRMYSYRQWLSYLYLLIFFAVPLIYVHGAPLFMLNFVESKFIVFGKIFWPQDFFILALAMVAGIVFIALFTVIYGRLFCGWACPQTVFMEFVFRRIEWWLEGSPAKQRALKDAPWTPSKIIRKAAKHLLFILFSAAIAHTFLAYIIGAREVWALMREPVSANVGLLTSMIIFTGLFYGVFAFVREIVCTTICPYGRLQGVLFDKDTMQIAYDYSRGETRGRLKKNEPRTSGDCVDCRKCVLVCPTGIDIRDGVQMDCVGCTACIDACDDVMLKVGFPTGLIRYTSENQIANRKPFHITTKIKAYTAVLLVLLISMGWMVATRNSVDTYISRVKGQLFQETIPGTLTNLFEAKLINKTTAVKNIRIEVDGFEHQIRLVGHNKIELQPETVSEFTFFLDIPKTAIQKRKTPISISIYENGKRIQRIGTNFLGPFQ
jgi:cytochrome c oxidase accessory protein FixG